MRGPIAFAAVLTSDTEPECVILSLNKRMRVCENVPGRAESMVLHELILYLYYTVPTPQIKSRSVTSTALT
jgi:hypothetical protein